MDPIIQRLDDENEIRKLVIMFSIAMDARDETLFRAAWADDIDLAIPPLGGDVIRLSGQLRGDDYAKNVITLLSEFKATQHVSTNHLISVKGDTGTCICYTFATHYLPVQEGEPWYTAGARYDLTAQRFSAIGWRFVRMKLTPLWSTGNPRLFGEAVRRIAAKRSASQGDA